MIAFPVAIAPGRYLNIIWSSEDFAPMLAIDAPGHAWYVPVRTELKLFARLLSEKRPIEAHSIRIESDLRVRYCGQVIGKAEGEAFKVALAGLARSVREAIEELPRGNARGHT